MAKVPVYKFNVARDCEGGTLFKKGTLLLTVTGPQAKLAGYGHLKSLLAVQGKVGVEGVESVYKLDGSTRFYATLHEEAHKKHHLRLHGMKIESNSPKFTVLIEHLEKERDKGVLHWVPTSFKGEYIKELIRDFTKDEGAEAQKIPDVPDKWNFQFKKKKGVELPHYVDLEEEDDEVEDMKKRRIFVFIPGRRPPCNLCGSGDHWWSTCPTRQPQGMQGRQWSGVVKGDSQGVQQKQQLQQPHVPPKHQPDAEGFLEAHGKKRKTDHTNVARVVEEQQSQESQTQDPEKNKLTCSWASIASQSPVKSPVKWVQSPEKRRQSPVKEHLQEEGRKEGSSREQRNRPRAAAKTPRKGSKQDEVVSVWSPLATQPEEALAECSNKERRPRPLDRSGDSPRKGRRGEEVEDRDKQDTVEVLSDEEDLFFNQLVIDESSPLSK